MTYQDVRIATSLFKATRTYRTTTAYEQNDFAARRGWDNFCRITPARHEGSDSLGVLRMYLYVLMYIVTSWTGANFWPQILGHCALATRRYSSCLREVVCSHAKEAIAKD